MNEGTGAMSVSRSDIDTNTVTTEATVADERISKKEMIKSWVLYLLCLTVPAGSLFYGHRRRRTTALISVGDSGAASLSSESSCSVNGSSRNSGIGRRADQCR